MLFVHLYRGDVAIAEDRKRLFAVLAKDFTERERFPSSSNNP